MACFTNQASSAITKFLTLLKHVHNRSYRIGFLYRHHFHTFFMERRMQTYGYIATAFIAKPAQCRKNSHRRNSNALRTHREAVVGSQYLSCTKHGFIIIHGLSLSHKNNIGYLFTSGHTDYLVKYVA